MRIEKNKVGAGSWMVCDQTWEVGLYFAGKRKLWKVFDQGCDQFKAELWDGLSITEVKADEREEGLGLRPPPFNLKSLPLPLKKSIHPCFSEESCTLTLCVFSR